MGRGMTLALACVGLLMATLGDAVGGESFTFTRNGRRYRAQVFTENGALTMKRPGAVDVLLVGGGGGGGQAVDLGKTRYFGGGGGAGGVVLRNRLMLNVGTYPIAVGAGGRVNDGNVDSEENRNLMSGGATTAFGLTALGGGYGAKGYFFTYPSAGASGGGASAGWNEGRMSGMGAKVQHAADDNLGNDGGDALHPYDVGGGGGAGGPGQSGGVGGPGFVCDITGTDVEYAVGGSLTSGAGADGFGNGGGSGERGGRGVAVVVQEFEPQKGFVVSLCGGKDVLRLPPLPAFQPAAHLEPTLVRTNGVVLVSVRVCDRDGTQCGRTQGSVSVALEGNAGWRIVGVKAGDYREGALVATNEVWTGLGRFVVAVMPPTPSAAASASLVLASATADVLGTTVALGEAAIPEGVWVRAPQGGASYEVPAATVTRAFRVAIRSDRVYNIFSNPEEPLRFTAAYRKLADGVSAVRIGYVAYDWDGRIVATDEQPVEMAVGETREITAEFDPEEERGIYFVEAYVRDASSGAELVFGRTNLVRLPPHEFRSTSEDSVFGIACWWNDPTLRDTENLLDRLGVRWTRYGDARIQHSCRAVNNRNGINWRSSTADQSDDSRAGFVRQQFVDCAERGAKLFEFGNEVNNLADGAGDGIGLCVYADQYVSWVKTFDRVMKAQGYDKNFGLLGFGMAGFDHAFATRMREAGILPMLKGFCIHPAMGSFAPDFPYGAPEREPGPHPGDYPTPGSESGCYWNFLGTVRAAKAFLDQYAPEMPLWVTEMYSCSFPNSSAGPSLRDGADNVVLEYALLKAEGVKVGMFYMLQDGVGGDEKGIGDNREYHFGLLNRDRSLKPSALGYCAIAEALDQAEFCGWMKMADPLTHGLLFTTPRGPMAVMWARWDGLQLTWKDWDRVCRHPEPWQDRWPTKRAVALPANGKVTRIDAIGRAKPLSAADGKAEILLDGSPCIVYGLDIGRIETY